MSNTYDIADGAIKATPFVLAGVVQIAKWIKFKCCKIYIENKHFHKVIVALDDEKKKNVRGWYSINAYEKTNIYETDRQTDRVGIYAECPVCGKTWESNNFFDKKFIPHDGKEFKIGYIVRDLENKISIDVKDAGFDSFIEVGFFYSDYISQKENYTFTLL